MYRYGELGHCTRTEVPSRFAKGGLGFISNTPKIKQIKGDVWNQPAHASSTHLLYVFSVLRAVHALAFVPTAAGVSPSHGTAPVHET